jgi:hypothetical protein
LFFAEDTLDLWQNFRYFLGISFIIPKSFSKGGKIIDFIFRAEATWSKIEPRCSTQQLFNSKKDLFSGEYVAAY